MSEYIMIVIAFLITIAILSLIESIMRILLEKNYYRASLNLLLSSILLIASFIILNWETGVKLVFY